MRRLIPFMRPAKGAKRASDRKGETGVLKPARRSRFRLILAGAGTAGLIATQATVETVDYQGQTVRYFVRAGDRSFQAINMINEHPFAEGSTVTIAFRPQDCAALPG